MPVHFLRDLTVVKRDLLAIGGLVEEAVAKATAALLERREDLAEAVIAGDDEIDRREVLLEEECLKALALHNPVAADLRFAADDAVFRIPAARLGLGYEAAGVEALAGAVGWSHALDLLLSARGIDAEEARRIGLVNEVRPAAELDDFVRERAGRIAENAPLTLRALKIAARELRKPVGARDLEAVSAAHARCFASEDYKEGTRAFLEVSTEPCDPPAAGCLKVREIQFDEQGIRTGSPGEWRSLPGGIEGYAPTPGEQHIVRVKRFESAAAQIVNS